ncbi:MAG: FAD-dependent monooxygenase [Myxococcota bacterium]
MSEPIHTPVLIIGAGPTGLVLSILLSRFGVDSLLVERNPSTCDHPQAHVVNQRSMEIFRALGIDEEIRAAALPLERGGHVRWVRSMSGDEFARLSLVPKREALPSLAALSPSPPVSCAQDRIEPRLSALARKGPGRVEFGSELVSLEPDDDGVSARVRTAEGEREVRAAWVVGCDGAGSTTRRLIGIPMEGPEALAHVVGIYFHADLDALAAERPAILYWTIDTEVPGTFIALDGSQRWVFHAAWDDQRVSLESYTEARCTEILRRAIGRDVPVEIRSVRPWTMTAQVATRYREGRVLLAGDAAHRFPPTGGFGMNTGVQDAHNLAWKLALVIADQAGAPLIDSYESERKPVGQGNCDWSVRNAAGLASVIGSGAAHQAQRLADGDVTFEALSAEIQALAEREAGHFGAIGRDLGFHYETGAILADGTDAPLRADPDREYVPNARPGARAPHFGLIQDRRVMSSLDLFEGRWTLVASPECADAWRDAAQAAPLPIAVEIVGEDIEDPNDAFPSLYGVEDGAVLVRPDGHVAWRTRAAPDDPERALAVALRSLLGGDTA